jgi:hypothetical protein
VVSGVYNESQLQRHSPSSQHLQNANANGSDFSTFVLIIVCGIVFAVATPTRGERTLVGAATIKCVLHTTEALLTHLWTASLEALNEAQAPPSMSTPLVTHNLFLMRKQTPLS